MLKRWLIGCSVLIVLCLILSAFSLLLQGLNVIPDATEIARTSLPTRIAAANATRRVELTATFNARPSITPTPAPTNTPTEPPLPTDIPAPTDIPLPSATPLFNEQDYVDDLDAGIFILAGGRNVTSIRVADNNGDRTAIIGYASTETTELGAVQELLDLFDAVGATIDAQNLDINAVAFSVGNAQGIATALVQGQVSDIQAWRNGQITDDEFIGRLEVVDM